MKTILYHGKIYREKGSFQQAMLIEEGVITRMGTDQEILSLPADRRMDLGGGLVLPGFIDSHLHLYTVGKRLNMLDLTAIRSIEELILQADRWLEESALPEGEFLIGWGWNQDYFTEKRMPSRHDLDRISTRHPIFLRRNCGHMAVANSNALGLAGIHEDSPDPEGGHLERNVKGDVTGILQERAMDLIDILVPRSDEASMRQNYLAAMQQALSWGITSVHSNDVMHSDYEAILRVLKQLDREQKLRPRFTLQYTLPQEEILERFLQEERENPSSGDFLRIGPVKLFKDGSLGGRTALLREPYSDDPQTIGIDTFPSEAFRDVLRKAEAKKIQLITHVIGDGAIQEVLEALEEEMTPGNPLRHGLVHAQITAPDLLQKISDLNILVYYQPVFLHYDLHVVEDRVGARAQHSYAFKTLFDAGVHTAYGTDAPVESMNPFHNLYCAITRKDLSGFPAQGYLPDQAMLLADAIDCYSRESAWAGFREKDLGRLQEGFRADLIGIDRDLFSVSPEEVRDATVLFTMVDGEILYQA